MPRIVRGLADNIIYHVINRGNGRQEVFHKDKDYEAFMKLIKEAKERYPVKLFGYSLMPNHFHMAVKPEKGEELSKWMQWLMTSHVRRYHRHYGSSGHVWQGRYKSFMIQEDSHLQMAMRYIEGKPVRAKLVQSAREWQWSSHEETEGKKERLLTDAVPIRMSVNRQALFGDATWQMKICKEFGMESTMKKKGRPKKELQA